MATETKTKKKRGVKFTKKEQSEIRKAFKKVKGLKKSQFAIPEPPADEEEEEYAVGCLPSIPFQVVYLGGISFPRITDPPVGIDTDEEEGIATIDRTIQRGDIVPMSKAKADYVIGCISKRIFRRMGGPPKKEELEKIAKGDKKEKAAGYILSINTDPTGPKKYVPDSRDEPMAAHVFMFKLSEANDIGIDPRWQTSRKAVLPSVLDLAEEDDKTETQE